MDDKKTKEEDEDADNSEDKDMCNAATDQQDDQLVNDAPDAYISAVAATVAEIDTESDDESGQSANEGEQHDGVRPTAQMVPAVPAPPPLEGDAFQRARASLHAAAETHGLSLVLRTRERRSLRRWLAMRVIANTRAVSPAANETQLAGFGLPQSFAEAAFERHTDAVAEVVPKIDE